VNADRTGDEQGLFNVDFAVKEDEALHAQHELDLELSNVWRMSRAGPIEDTTKATIGR
jgi:hypothetical protein